MSMRVEHKEITVNLFLGDVVFHQEDLAVASLANLLQHSISVHLLLFAMLAGL